jgi:hypothetical protein
MAKRRKPKPERPGRIRLVPEESKILKRTEGKIIIPKRKISLINKAHFMVPTNKVRVVYHLGKGRYVFCKINRKSGGLEMIKPIQAMTPVSMGLGSCVSVMALHEKPGKIPSGSVEAVFAHIALPSSKVLSATAKEHIRKRGLGADVDSALEQIIKLLGKKKDISLIVEPGNLDNPLSGDIIAGLQEHAKKKGMKLSMPFLGRNLTRKGKKISIIKLDKDHIAFNLEKSY